MPLVVLKAVLCGMISPTLQPAAASSSSMMNHGPRFWLKALANLNMSVAVVTEETSQVEMSWLKTVVERNISFMLVTLEVFQVERGRLKS